MLSSGLITQQIGSFLQSACHFKVVNRSHVMWRTQFLKVASVGAAVLQYGCIAHCTLEFAVDFVVCSGPSMTPTIRSSDIVLSEHFSVRGGQIAVGDVVIAKSPTNPHQNICKRVTGLEGDWIEHPPPGYGRKCIPRGHIWLQGDNGDNSTDSRTYGPVPYALLRSRVFFKVWPLKDFGLLRDEEAVGR